MWIEIFFRTGATAIFQGIDVYSSNHGWFVLLLDPFSFDDCFETAVLRLDGDPVANFPLFVQSLDVVPLPVFAFGVGQSKDASRRRNAPNVGYGDCRC